MKQVSRLVLLTIYVLAAPALADPKLAKPPKLTDLEDNQSKPQTSTESDSDKKYECTKDSVATQFKVPNEPDVVGPILAAYFSNRNTAPLKAEPRIIKVLWSDEKNPHTFCVEWDIMVHDKISDFITCRRVMRDKTGKLKIDRYPAGYLVDIDRLKSGNMTDMHMFVDKDVDNDICDPQFIYVGKFKDLANQKPPP